MKKVFYLTALAVCFAFPVMAQQSCGPRDVIITNLAERYSETRQVVAIAANSSMVEVFASLESGTWTITVTQPNGPTCLVAAGQSFELVDEELLGEAL